MVAKLYKARYFPTTTFLQSSLGHNPSFIWRSICEAKGVLERGVRWRVGTGENISILEQPWLNHDLNPFISTSSPVLEGKTVSSLFQIGSNEWDLDVIKDVFNDRDQYLILNTGIHNEAGEDTLSGVLTRVCSMKRVHGVLKIRIVSGLDYGKSKHLLNSLMWSGVLWHIAYQPLFSCNQNEFKSKRFVQFVMERLNQFFIVW